jgi:predicted ATP-grasp superfamily ATP-dependent carboligase
MKRATAEVGALVLGGDYRGLGIVRSLGRRGVPVWVAQHGDALATHSRYSRHKLTWPGPFESDQTDFLLRFGKEHGLDGWVLFPTADKSAEFISRNTDALGDFFRLTTSPWPQWSIAQNKTFAYQRAEQLGIAVPSTWCTQSVDEAAALDLEYPVILKPASGVIDNPISDVKVWRIENRDELLRRYVEASAFLPAGHVMIQEIIPGGGDCQLSFASTCRDGEVVAYLTARRTRQMPPDFGRASTFVETVDIPEVIEPSRRIIADLELTGLVEVEFKRDPRNGRVKLLDVNARAWGWHSIGASAGVDFPYLAWQVAQGIDVEPATGRPGVRWVRMSTDVPTYAKEILARRERLGAYLKTFRSPLEGPLWANDDPMPVFVEPMILAARVVQRARRRKDMTVGGARPISS